MRNETKDQSVEIKKLNTKINLESEKHQDTKNQLSQVRLDLKTEVLLRQKYESANDALEQRLDTMLQRVVTLEARSERNEKENSRLNDELQALKAKDVENSRKISLQSVEIKELKLEADASQALLQKKADESRLQRQVIDGTLDLLDIKIQSIEAKERMIKAITQERDELKARVEGLTTQVEALTELVAKQSKQLQKLQEKIDNLANDISGLKPTNDETQ